MISDKKHWYDGWFYETFVDLMLEQIRTTIFQLVERKSSVIDVGCGTGALVFKLADKCENLVGIDLSKTMIKRALERKKENHSSNIEFLHSNASQLSKVVDRKFDYAIMALTLHEMPARDRIKVLSEVKTITNKIIIADFDVPRPRNPAMLGTYLVEYLAGRDHFKNYKSFIASGGLQPLLDETGLKIEKRFFGLMRAFKIVEVSW